MRVVIQRVAEASVDVGGERIAAIGVGLLVLVGVERGDDEKKMIECARKIVSLRIFSDQEGRMNRSLEEAGGSVLVVSQFTLAGSLRKGRRPSFEGAEDPQLARRRFDQLVAAMREEGATVETGRFGAMMDVALVNDGPVTFVLEL